MEMKSRLRNGEEEAEGGGWEVGEGGSCSEHLLYHGCHGFWNIEMEKGWNVWEWEEGK